MPNHCTFARTFALATFAMLLACDKAGGAPQCPEPTAVATATGGGLDGELVKTAAAGAIKMKVRTDANGVLVKQSVYHQQLAAIPEPVQKLAAAKFPGAKTDYVESELYAEHGRVYEIEVTTADGQHCEIAASADAAELYTECIIDAAALPAAVAATVAKLYPGAKVLEAETKKGPKIDELTVEIQVEGGEHYLRVAPDGTVIQRLVRIPAIIEIPLQ